MIAIVNARMFGTCGEISDMIGIDWKGKSVQITFGEFCCACSIRALCIHLHL